MKQSRRLMLPLVALVLFLQGLSERAGAQGSGNLLSDQDPGQVLRELIATFQNCGPTQNYLLLGQAVYQTVYFQTRGTGCYPQLQMMGRLTHIKKLSSFQLPAGPVTTYETDHENGSGTWQIGISRLTQHVEWLAFQPTLRPIQPGKAAPPRPPPSPPPVNKVVNDPAQGCVMYPVMCSN